jgi:nucleoside-diphosphate-sugar epimerase
VAARQPGVSRLFCFGLGYCAAELARRLSAEGWSIAGTARSPEAAEALRAQGFEACVFSGTAPGARVRALLRGSTHLLVSAAPDENGDPALRYHRSDVAGEKGLVWIGYLSTLGVYGGQGGAWLDEDTVPRPPTPRAAARLEAEKAWMALGEEMGAPAHVFRLAGIYGPGRNAFDRLRAGTAQRIVKPGQVFNRVHVADIATVLQASIARPRAGAVYNATDDEPSPPQDVIARAAELLGI